MISHDKPGADSNGRADQDATTADTIPPPPAEQPKPKRRVRTLQQRRDDALAEAAELERLIAREARFDVVIQAATALTEAARKGDLAACGVALEHACEALAVLADEDDAAAQAAGSAR